MAEGSGCSQVGNQTINWTTSDVFALPTWARHAHQAERVGCGALFDQRSAVLDALELYRESE